MMRPTSRARVILQPAGGSDAADHYDRTIRNPVRLSSILEFLEDPDADALAKQYPTGWTRVWGVTLGANGVNRVKWLQFAAGDRVLFCGQGKVFASASLRYRVHNRPLALRLWRSDKDHQTWEYVYFVGEPRDQDISYSQLATVLQYSPEFVVQGVNILAEEKSAALLEAFDLVDD
jgi:hypothetical protein